MDLDETPSPFMDLPNEMWEPIFKKLTQKQALNLRLVNTDFKMMVDGLYEDWVIRLDEQSPYLDNILDLRVKKVILKLLMNPLSNRPSGIIFKYPTLLKEIHVPAWNISAENLHALLQYKNFKRMKIEFGTFHLPLPDTFWKTLDPQIGYYFPHLHTLEVTIYPTHGDSFDDNAFDRLMTRSRMPSLKSLTVAIGHAHLTQSEECKLLFALFSFLGRHGQTLKQLHCMNRMLWRYSLSPSYDLVLSNCSALEILSIEGRQGLGQHGYAWSSLVQNQSKLVEIKLGIVFDHLSTTCAKIFVRNFETLTQVTISIVRANEDFEEEETDQFDVSIFGQCVNLRKLSLHWCSNEIIDSWVGQTIFFEVLKLFTLPKEIETVEFDDVCVYSEDLSEFLKSHACLTSLIVDRYTNTDWDQYDILNASLSDGIKRHGSLKESLINTTLLH